MSAGFWDDIEPDIRLTTSVVASLRCLRSVPGQTYGGLYASYGWLAAMEQISPDVTRYVVAAAGDDVQGVLPVYLLDEGDAGYYHPSRAFGLTGAVGGPVAVLGGRAGYVTGWMLTDDASLRPRILATLLRAAAQLAGEKGACVLTAQYLPAGAAALLAQTRLAHQDEVIAHAAHATMDLPGTCFEDYLQGLATSRRSIVRRDMVRFASSGLSVHTCRLSEAMDFAPRLLAAVQTRRGGAPDVERMRSALLAQVASLDEVSTVIVAATSTAEPVAYSLSYTHDDTLFVRLAGLDHDRAEAAAAYFVTTYYETVRLAYDLGLTKVHIGIASYRPKVLRGGVLAPLYGIVRRPNRTPLSVRERESVGTWLINTIQQDLGALAPPDTMFAAVDWNGGTR
jgi:predicted N-acyltransferase